VNREGFVYDRENDRYQCHQGKYLPFSYYVTDRIGNRNKMYSSRVGDCRDCPFKLTCIGKSSRKVLENGEDRWLFEQMHEKMLSKKGRKMRKIRQSTVEPVLGSLINFTGMKRVNTRGLKQANKCMVMAAIAYNLKKLMKFKTKSVLANIQAIAKTPDKYIGGFIQCINNVLSINIRLTT